MSKVSNKDKSEIWSVRVSKKTVDAIERISKINPFNVLTRSGIVKYLIDVGVEEIERKFKNKSKNEQNI